MTTDPRQPGSSDRTPRFDEHDLLAFVEDALPAARADLVRRTVARDPALAAKVEAMRADRAMLADLVEDRAPEGIVAAALGQLELGALLDADPRLRLTDAPAGDAASANVELAPMPGDPMSVLRVGQRKRASRVPWTPLVGVAAVVLLGVGVWTSGLVTRDMLPGGSAGESDMLAQGDIVPPGVGRTSGGPSTLEVAPAVANVEVEALASAASERAQPETSSLASAIDAQIDSRAGSVLNGQIGVDVQRDGDAQSSAESTSRDGLAFDRRANPIVVDAARAAQLAAEGRLAILVRFCAAPVTAITDLLDKPTAAGRLAMPDADIARDSQLARAVIPRPEFVWPIDAFAGGDGDGFARRRDPARPQRPPPPPSVLTVDMLADASALERARLALDTDAAFIELAEPTGLSVPMQPSEVLWWTQPADRWAPRVRVPVVLYEAR